MNSSNIQNYPLLPTGIVERVCGRTHAARGRDVYRRGQVLGAAVAEEIGELMGIVMGTAPDPYVQHIALSASMGFANECTCPVGQDCKHVAAVLYHYIAHREDIARGGIGPGGEGALDTDTSLEEWLGALAEAGEAPTGAGDQPEPGSHVLLFRLDPPVRSGASVRRAAHRAGYGGGERPTRAEPSVPPARLTLVHSRLLMRGGYGKEKTVSTSSWYLPTWYTAIDRDIVALLIDSLRAEYGYYGQARLESGVAVTGARGTRLLRLLAESGRCFVGDDRERPIRFGGERALAFEWVQQDDGRSRLAGVLEGATRWTLVPTEPPWYLADVEITDNEVADSGASERLVGPIADAPSAALLDALLSGPALDASGARQAGEFLDRPAMRARMPRTRLPLSGGDEVVDEAPVPVLVLHAPSGSTHPLDYRATFALRYGEDRLPFEEERPAPHTRLDDARGARLIRRRIAEEHAHHEMLLDCCPELEPVADETDALAPHTPDVASRVLAWRDVLAALPELEAIGWEIETRPPFAVEFERIDGIDASVGDVENGWFDLSLAMTHEGQRFALLPLIVEWLEAGESERPILVESESGDWLEIAPETFMPVAETLIELYDHFPDGEALSLPRQRALLLEALGESWGENAVWRGGEALFALAERLRDFSGIVRPALPSSLDATLRPYQHDGVAWLGFLAEYGFGGILADDMGLGKTLQTIAHLLVEREAGRLPGATLVIAPTSLLGNWERETNRFAPSFRCVVWHGAARHERGLDTASHDLVITSYTLALRDRDFLAEQPFECLVLDEAQMIKNPLSKTSQAVRSLPIERRLCLSGTPLENHLGELWSQFDFLMPGYLGDRDRFTRRFRTPIEKHGDEERQARLNTLVRPFMLRRRKEEVAKELPPKTDIVQSVTLGAAQARLYESIRLSMEKKVKRLLAGKGLARSHIEVLDALLKLRQTCCHPALVKLPSARKVQESAKTEQLLTMLEELVSEGRRILLFSQFTAMLSLIERELADRGIAHVKLTGRTRKRDAVIDAFQNGEVPLFLISLKAGGTGLNLTAADTVIHYDPWWNPAVEEQASARAHRIGQDKPVFVYRLVAADTVEERILEMQARKRALAEATIDGEGTALSGMSADELLSLFAARGDV